MDIAIIGAGRIGKIHAGNAAAAGLSVKYIVDPIASAAEQLARQVGARTASLDDALADASVEGVVIASSTDTHLDFSINAIEAGKAVFCEKPIDLHLDRARGAASILGAPDARFFLGFNRRFDPHFARLHTRLRSGEMGALETLHIVSHDPAPPPIDYVKVSGGLFKDMSIHDFDMSRWLLGEEPVDVYAAGSCLVDQAIAAAGDIDTAKVLLRTASGRLCVISNSRRSGYGYDQRIEAFCAKGMVGVGNVHESTLERWSDSGPEGPPLQNFFLDRYAQAYRAEMDHFAGVIAGTHAPLVGYADGIAALALAEAAMTSHRAKAVARVPS